MSAVSKPGFFSSGVTIACFFEAEAGSRPTASDELTILVMSGSRMSMNSRARNVRMGSGDDDLTGVDIMIRRTSFQCPFRLKPTLKSLAKSTTCAQRINELTSTCTAKYRARQKVDPKEFS